MSNFSYIVFSLGYKIHHLMVWYVMLGQQLIDPLFQFELSSKFLFHDAWLIFC